MTIAKSVHMTQFRSPSLPDGLPAAANNECGPTSALMAVRRLGLDLPGFQGQHSQAAIDAARKAGTGNTNDVGTWAKDLVGIGRAAGAAVGTTPSLAAAEAAVRAGGTAVVSGDCSVHGIWNASYIHKLIHEPHNDHWIALTGWDARRREYIVDDPLMSASVRVPASMLQAFHGADPSVRIWGNELIFRRPSPSHGPEAKHRRAGNATR